MDVLHANIWWAVFGLCPENAATLEIWMNACRTTLLCCTRSGKMFKRSPTAAACERGSWSMCRRLFCRLGKPKHYHIPSLACAAAAGGHLQIIQRLLSDIFSGWTVHIDLMDIKLSREHSSRSSRKHSLSEQAPQYTPLVVPVRPLRVPHFFALDMARPWLGLFYPAAINGHVHICKFILSMQGVYLGLLKHNFEYGMLVTVAERGHTSMCKWLFQLLRTNELECEIEGALMGACRGGHLDLCKWLCLMLMSPNHDPPYGMTARQSPAQKNKHRHVLNQALVWAASHGHLAMCQYLHSLGAAPRTDRHLAFRAACRHGRLAVCQWLFSSQRMSLDDVCVYNNVAFRDAAHNKHEHVCAWLKTLASISDQK